MRTSITLLLLFLLPIGLMAQPFHYEIRGSIKKYHLGQKIYFMHSDKGQVIDSAAIVNSNFLFKGNAVISFEPGLNHTQSLARLIMEKNGTNINFKHLSDDDLEKVNNVQLYLEPGTTLVTISDNIAMAVIKPPQPNYGHYTLDSIDNALNKNMH